MKESYVSTGKLVAASSLAAAAATDVPVEIDFDGLRVLVERKTSILDAVHAAMACEGTNISRHPFLDLYDLIEAREL